MDDLGVPLFLETPICWATSHSFSFGIFHYFFHQTSKVQRIAEKKTITSGAGLINNENSPSTNYQSICFEIQRNHIPNPRIPQKLYIYICFFLNSSIPPKTISATKPKLHSKLHTSQAQQWEAKALAQQLWSLSWPCHPKTVPFFRDVHATQRVIFYTKTQLDVEHATV